MRWRCSELLLAALIACAAPAAAEDLSPQQMIQSLQPKKSATRSLAVGAGVVSPEDRQFVEGLRGASRSIVVKERQKLSAVVQKYDMPQLDLEVNFAFNSSNISTRAMPLLMKLGQALADPSLSGQSVVISGHTDAVDSATFNQKLSEAWAWSVGRFLVQNFMIDPTRIIVVGYGEEELKNIHHPAGGENRRVTIINITM